MNELKGKKCAVLGAGIIGLSTAVELYRRFEEASGEDTNCRLDLTIIAETFDLETTSDGAGGLFRPDDRFMGGVPKETARKWVKDSFEYFHEILFSADGGLAGVFQSSGYQLFDDDRQEPGYKEFIYQFRNLTCDELSTFPRKFKSGYFCTTIGIETRMFMKYLTSILARKGATFVKRSLSTLEQFVEQTRYNVVFNCLGLGNVTFCNDNRMVPIRGQMIRVKAPWIKHFYYTDDNCYIIPNVNTVCLGGTRQVNNPSLALDKKDSNGILERCKELCPSLENCLVEWEWVGLRPHREPTRVELETVTTGGSSGRQVIVVHNYGHGGNGVSLAPGTVRHALSLLEKRMASIHLKSKL